MACSLVAEAAAAAEESRAFWSGAWATGALAAEESVRTASAIPPPGLDLALLVENPGPNSTDLAAALVLFVLSLHAKSNPANLAVSTNLG